jgi:hypothetical protein
VSIAGPRRVDRTPQAELLNCEYFHVVFTVPDKIAAIAYQNKEVVYNILFQATAETLRTIALDLRLSVLAALDLVTHALQLHCKLRTIDRRRVLLCFIEFLRLQRSRISVGGFSHIEDNEQAAGRPGMYPSVESRIGRAKRSMLWEFSRNDREQLPIHLLEHSGTTPGLRRDTTS